MARESARPAFNLTPFVFPPTNERVHLFLRGNPRQCADRSIYDKRNKACWGLWMARVQAADRFLANEIRAGDPEGRRVFHQNLRCVSRC